MVAKEAPDLSAERKGRDALGVKGPPRLQGPCRGGAQANGPSHNSCLVPVIPKLSGILEQIHWRPFFYSQKGTGSGDFFLAV